MSDVVRVFLLCMCMLLCFKLGVHYAYSRMAGKMLDYLSEEMRKLCEKLGVPVQKKEEKFEGLWK